MKTNIYVHIYHNGANIMKAFYNFLKMFLRNVFFYSVNIFIYHSFYELSRGLKTIYSWFFIHTWMTNLYWSTLNDMPTKYQFLPSDIYLWIFVIWFHQIKNVRKKIFLTIKFTLTSKDSFVNRNHWRMALHEK